jgi:hypothetical protein
MRAVRMLLAGTLLLAAGCGGGDDGACAHRPPPTPLDRSQTGTITGSVRFVGEPPPQTELRLGGDAACAAQHTGPVLAGDVLVRDGRLQNAFVYLKDGLGDRRFAVPSEPVTIDQRGCLYVPRVAGAQVCQPIAFLNSDPTLHNVHGTPEASSAWNFSMSPRASQRSVRLERPEVMVPVRCDVHPWMRGFIGVVDHPYFAVTGPDGAFTLSDVPAGDYVLASWHERFGTREARVHLEARGTAEATLTYGTAR